MGQAGFLRSPPVSSGNRYLYLMAINEIMSCLTGSSNAAASGWKSQPEENHHGSYRPEAALDPRGVPRRPRKPLLESGV